MSVSKVMQRITFKGLLALIEEKKIRQGLPLEQALRKMATAPQIAGYLAKDEADVRRNLDALIRCKYVRYYDVSGLRWFGVTKLGYERWRAHIDEQHARHADNERIAAEYEQQQLDDENAESVVVYESYDESDKVACEYCGKHYRKQNIGRHRAACKKRAA